MTPVKIDLVTFPIDTIQAKLKIHGIYSLPDEWKATDESNPGLFTYAVRMSKFQVLKGKICPRELTQKQKKQQQQKNKKGGKKDSKNPEPNEEQERIRKAEEQRQRQRQELFAKLSEEEQFYHTAEDIYRAPFLKFEEGTSQKTFRGNDCLIFEERLLKDKGDWIYVYKIPTASQEELAKMRKTKPKTLANINDLNPVVMRAWVNFQQLSTSDDKIQIKQLRCKIHQVDKTPQTPEPNLQKTYIKVTFSLNEPIIRQKDSYTTSSLIADPEKAKQIPPQVKCLDQIRQELGLAVQSLAMEYSTMFWKEINMQEEQRNSQIFLNNKKGELQKRKEQFLYDFNVTGKYKILKDRIKKCIVHLCQTKYKDFFIGMKSFNGIKCNSQDQIYSEIYNLLVASYQETLFKIIHEKEQSLGEILVLNRETIKQERDTLLNAYKDESVIDRVKRTIREYEVLQDFLYGQKVIRMYIEEYPELTELKYFYGTYCLKYNLKQAKQLLPFIQEYLTKQKFTLTEDKKIQFMLTLFNIGGENYLKGWIILREIIESQTRVNQPSEILSKWLLLASVVLKNMDNFSLSIKYRSFAMRENKKFIASQSVAENGVTGDTKHKQMPQKSEIPSISGVANYVEVGTKQDLMKFYDGLVQLLNGFSAFELIKKVLTQKDGSSQNHQSTSQNEQPNLEKSLPQINKLLVSHDQQSQNILFQLTQRIYSNVSVSGSPSEKSKALDLLIRSHLLKINSRPSKSNEDLTSLQTYLKKSLMTNSQPLSRFTTLLRLGYVYCQKQQYGNSRACLLKYLQKSAQFPEYLSGLSYKLLGIACLKGQKYSEAVENFKHWNMADSKNRDSWLYLALGFAQSKQLISVNQCLTQFKKRCQNQDQTEEQYQVLQQISRVIQNANSQTQYQRVLTERILEALA